MLDRFFGETSARSGSDADLGDVGGGNRGERIDERELDKDEVIEGSCTVDRLSFFFGARAGVGKFGPLLSRGGDLGEESEAAIIGESGVFAESASSRALAAR